MSLNPQNIGPGQEQHEEYTVPASMTRNRKPRRRCQYDYRAESGALFSCTAPTLEDARALRDEWLKGRAA